MKVYFTAILLLLTTSFAWSQKFFDQSLASNPEKMSYARRSTIFTVSLGVRDWYKHNDNLPDSFVHEYTKGFSPLYFRVEHAFTEHIGVSIYLMYDHFYYNYSKAPNFTPDVYTYHDKVTVLNGGIVGYYHFRKLIPKVPQLDLFAGLGVSMSQVQHKYGLNDTSSKVEVNPTSNTESITSPIIKIGARYYIDRNISLYGDLGYDKISVLSIGVSYRML